MFRKNVKRAEKLCRELSPAPRRQTALPPPGPRGRMARRRPPQPAWAAFQALVFVLVAIRVTDQAQEFVILSADEEEEQEGDESDSYIGRGRQAKKTVKLLKNSAKIVVLKPKVPENSKKNVF